MAEENQEESNIGAPEEITAASESGNGAAAGGLFTALFGDESAAA